MSKITPRLKELLRIAIFRTIFYNFFSSRVTRKNGGWIIFYKGAAINIESGSNLTIDSGLLLYGYGYGIPKAYSPDSIIRISGNSSMYVYGKCIIEYNSDILVKDGAKLEIGKNGYFNCNTFIRCHKGITIGEEFLGANNLSLRDNDGHTLNGIYKANPVIIEDHVWCGMNVTILKGVTIGSGSVMGANSLVTKSVPEACLVCGSPAKVIQQNVCWKK